MITGGSKYLGTSVRPEEILKQVLVGNESPTVIGAVAQSSAKPSPLDLMVHDGTNWRRSTAHFIESTAWAASTVYALNAIVSRPAAGKIVAGTNTGNGAVTALTLGAKAKPGIYSLTCVAAAANGGTFSVSDPEGFRLSDARVAVAYVSAQINFIITDGAADFIVGDSFTYRHGEGYEATTAGTSHSAAPTWPTSASTVTDGTVVWTYRGFADRLSDFDRVGVVLNADADGANWNGQIITRGEVRRSAINLIPTAAKQFSALGALYLR